MSEEIQLEEPKPSRPWGYIALGVAVGLAIGVAVGYYVNVGTLRYAYKLLTEAQSPPPDVYLIAYSPGKTFFLTAMGSTISVQDFSVNERFKYLGNVNGYKVLIVNNYVYLLKDNAVVTKLYLEGVFNAVIVNNSIYAATPGAVYKLSVPDLVELNKLPLNNIRDIYGIDEEKSIFVLTEGKLYQLNPALVVVREFDRGGDKLFVGAYYIFIAKGNTVISLNRETGKEVAFMQLDGNIAALRACRGLLFVSTPKSLYVARVPDLQHVKVFNVGGVELVSDPSCTMVYLISDDTVYLFLVPSLTMHEIKLASPLDGLEVRTGGAGAITAAGGKRQIALACGG